MATANEIMKHVWNNPASTEGNTNMSVSHNFNNRWNSNIESVIESRAINAN